MSTVEDIMSTAGDILSNLGDTQYRGDCMMHAGGYPEYHGGVQHLGGYHLLQFEYHGEIS